MRTIIEQVFESALAAVDPGEALRRTLRVQGASLLIGRSVVPLPQGTGRIIVLGAGKGVWPMASALETLLPQARGLVVTKDGHSGPLKHIEIIEAAHPIPDARSQNAGRRLLAMASEATENDLVIVLLTGGASALTCVPALGITLEEMQETTRRLMAAGASIQQLNTVRKHISDFSGGGLARAIWPARTVALVVSDVIGDDLSVIGGGAIAPDPTTCAMALSVLVNHGLYDLAPSSIKDRLRSGSLHSAAETPKPNSAIFSRTTARIIASNAVAQEAARVAADKAGFDARLIGAPISGEASIAARRLVAIACDVQRTLKAGDRPILLIAGGETIVTIHGRGLGGRCQEMALAACLALKGTRGITALFAGTDGSDGPTSADGGWADSSSVMLMEQGGIDPELFLKTNNSNAALGLIGGLLLTGPTRTNVADLILIAVEPTC